MTPRPFIPRPKDAPAWWCVTYPPAAEFEAHAHEREAAERRYGVREGEREVTDPTADWQEWPTDVDCRERDAPWARHMMQCYRERLRDTAAALRTLALEIEQGVDPIEARNKGKSTTYDNARAILARLEQEGLTS